MTKLALKNPIGVLMFGLALALLGIIGLQKIPLDLFPKVDVPVIMIGTLYPGAAPEVVERTVSYRIERAVGQTANLDYVSSQSRYGLSVVRAWYRWGSNIDAAELQVSQEVNSILKQLPHGIFPPFVVAFDASNIPVATLTMESTELDENALYDLATNTIAPQLAGLAGTDGGQLLGLAEKVRSAPDLSARLSATDALSTAMATQLGQLPPPSTDAEATLRLQVHDELSGSQNRVTVELRRYREAESAWRDAASGGLAGLAVGLGFAEGPP